MRIVDEPFEIRRARHADLAAIASLVQAADPQAEAGESQVMDWLYSKGLWVAFQEDRLAGVAAWQAENLVAVTDVFLLPPVPGWAEAGRGLLQTIEAEAGILMCEVHIVLLPCSSPETIRTLLQQQGYESKRLEELHRIWQEVLSDLVGEDSHRMVKGLRDRVLAPV